MSRLSPKAIKRIENAARELAAGLGLDIREIEYARSDIGWTLSVIVDRQGGVGIDDCERLARPLSRKLDELDLIQDQYFLEVSSPGVAQVETGSEEETG